MKIIMMINAYDEFWEENQYTLYLEHKTDNYSNQKRKLAKFNKGFIFYLTLYSRGAFSGFSFSNGKKNK